MALRYDVGNQWIRVNGVVPDDQDKWAIVWRMESAGFSRIQGEAGVSIRLLDREWTIDSDLALGGVWQWGPIEKKGPSLEWRIQTQRDEGEWRPWAHIALQPTLLIDRYEIISEDSEWVEYNFDQSTEFEMAAGITKWSRRGWNWGVGVDYFQPIGAKRGWPGVHVTVGKGYRLR